jgi:hypothetical protein
MLFDGLDSWVLDSITSTWNQNPVSVGPGTGYDIGPIMHGEKPTVTLTLDPKTPGNPTLSFISYAAVDPSLGIVDTNSSIDNGGAVQMQVAINP